MSSHDHDYDFDGEVQATVADLSELDRLVRLMRHAEQAVAEAEAQLDQAKADLAEVSCRLLPEAMERCGVVDFTTASGTRVRVKESVKCSIPEASRSAAHTWLDANGYGHLIDRVAAVKIPRGEIGADMLGKVVDAAHDLGLDCSPTQSVHHSRLNSWATEITEDGVTLPDCFKVFRRREAKLK